MSSEHTVSDTLSIFFLLEDIYIDILLISIYSSLFFSLLNLQGDLMRWINLLILLKNHEILKYKLTPLVKKETEWM